MTKEIALTLKQANMLITDSEYIRQEIASRFGWPLGKTRAIPLACSPDFRLRTSEEVCPVLEMHGLRPWSRSLFVGTIEPRKNLDALLDAYALLPQSMMQQWPLVLIGYPLSLVTSRKRAREFNPVGSWGSIWAKNWRLLPHPASLNIWRFRFFDQHFQMHPRAIFPSNARQA